MRKQPRMSVANCVLSGWKYLVQSSYFYLFVKAKRNADEEKLNLLAILKSKNYL
jgi:hypothetical protein